MNSNNAGLSEFEFVREFAMANNAQIDAARLVIRNSTSPVVRGYAQKIIDDQTTAAVKLRSAARDVTPRIPIPEIAVSPEARDALANLRTLDEPQLDRAYMHAELAGHNDTIGLLDWEAANGPTPALRNLASTLRPTELNHLGMVEAYHSSHGQSTAIDAAGVIYPAPIQGNMNAINPGNGTTGASAGVVTNGTQTGTPPNAAPAQNATAAPK